MTSTTIHLACKWLETCLVHHETCRKKGKFATIWTNGSVNIVNDIGHEDCMPRYLLALNPDDQLAKLEQIPKTATLRPYLALSHRWGPSETFKTTHRTIADFSAGFPLQDLPKTFLHAAEVTLALGYRHLWIDSLCIIQDDPEFWKNEAPRMSLVYGSAACTIMAMDAEDSDGGLLIDNSPSPGSLVERAWVVQEQMISPRSLIYSRNTVRWECRECDATTTEPDLACRSLPAKNNDNCDNCTIIPSHPKELFNFLLDFRVPGVNPGEDQHRFMDIYDGLNGEPADYEPFLRAWWRFVELYTPCRLTYASDRFLAMNGIAAASQRHTLLRNTWGLWRDFLAHDLTWSIDPAGPEPRRPNKWLAPFWSWASTENGRVVNEYYRRLPVVPQLMIKPEIFCGTNTSFDQALPIPAFRTSQDYAIELKGDLRSAELEVSRDSSGGNVYSISLEKTGRFSEDEEHVFRPDAVMRPGKKQVRCFLIYHYDKKELDIDHYIDVRLVYFMSGTEEDRIMKRTGYLETRYKEMRGWDGINEDFWWKHVQLR